MSLTVAELNAIISRIAPLDIAEPWDNVGLQAGNPEWPLQKVLVALDVSSAVMDEAVAMGATAIVTHHPLIFSPLKNLREDNPVHHLLAQMIRQKVALIVAHTNLDKSPSGPNYALAHAMDVNVERWLRPDNRQEYVKVVVFTPEGHESAIIEAIDRGGGGGIGAYSHCTFRSAGTGTFKPLAGANPFIGAVGKMEEVREWRLESLVPRIHLADVLREIRATHPYEEPALDVIPVEIAASSSGLGVIGSLQDAVNLEKWKEHVEKRIRALLPCEWEGAQILGCQDKNIQRIAICSGSGNSLIGDAIRAGVDCLVTGEVNYHSAAEAVASNLPILCLGHFASEAAAMPFFADALRREAPQIDFAVSQTQADLRTPA